jgi:hypothetical protein
MFAIRMRTHWHTELTGPGHAYAEIKVSNTAHVWTVKLTLEICGLTVTADDAARGIDK